MLSRPIFVAPSIQKKHNQHPHVSPLLILSGFVCLLCALLMRSFFVVYFSVLSSLRHPGLHHVPRTRDTHTRPRCVCAFNRRTQFHMQGSTKQSHNCFDPYSQAFPWSHELLFSSHSSPQKPTSVGCVNLREHEHMQKSSVCLFLEPDDATSTSHSSQQLPMSVQHLYLHVSLSLCMRMTSFLPTPEKNK